MSASEQPDAEQRAEALRLARNFLDNSTASNADGSSADDGFRLLLRVLLAAEAEVAELGNALARERAKPGGSFDQWARIQRLENALREIAEAEDVSAWAIDFARAALSEPTEGK